MLNEYMAAATEITTERPLLVERFLGSATEAEADAVANGMDAFIPTVMEHIEYAGIHSGDSACVIPPVSISEEHIRTIIDYTRKIAVEMKVVGLMNIQYAIENDTVYVLEANPRASRTVPLVSKICKIYMAKIATEIIMAVSSNKAYPLEKLENKRIEYYGVKEAVLPFNMFPEVDPVLGPEMKSTGEVLGIADSFELAFIKAQESINLPIPTSGTVLISVNDTDKADALEVAKVFLKAGFKIRATKGTCRYFRENSIACEEIKKIYEGRPNIVDGISNREINLIINTPKTRASEFDDSYIRKFAIKSRLPYITTMTAALISARGILAYIENNLEIPGLKSLQD
jgi:carbamoyl-phosphate synthase large subunit